MPQTNIDLHFADALGRARVLHAVVSDGGWSLHASIEGATFTKRCDSWQAVERTLTWLRRHAHVPSVTAPPGRGPGLVAALLLLSMMVGAGAAVAQPQEPSTPAEIAFERAVQDYALMHRRLEQGIGTLTINTPIDEINRMIQQLAAAIRAERADAKQGDIFTPALAPLLRGRIAETLFEHRYSVDEARSSSRLDGIDYARVKLQVNGTFPWVLGAAMLPCLIDALPPLPPELQYRIVDSQLVLIDVHASLIVDLLPYALADMTARNVPPAGARQ